MPTPGHRRPPLPPAVFAAQRPDGRISADRRSAHLDFLNRVSQVRILPGAPRRCWSAPGAGAGLAHRASGQRLVLTWSARAASERSATASSASANRRPCRSTVVCAEAWHALSGIPVLADRREVFGQVASMPTAWAAGAGPALGEELRIDRRVAASVVVRTSMLEAEQRASTLSRAPRDPAGPHPARPPPMAARA